VRAFLVLVLVLVALLVVVDRVGVAVAEDRVADAIAQEAGLASPPTVDVVGFPILHEAVRGRYDEVRIAFSAEDLDQPEGTRADVVLRGVEVPLSRLFAGAVEQVPVEAIDGTATLSYALLAEQLGPDTGLERDGDGLRITRSLDLAGQDVPLTAEGTVSLDGDELVIDVRGAAGAGVELPDEVVERIDEALDLRYPVPELPYGLELTDVRPGDDGVLVRARAGATVIEAAPE
jgi:hypothetical protein